MITGYRVITSADQGELAEAVLQAVADGWVVQGGVSAVLIPGDLIEVQYSQAIVKP